MSVPFDEIVNGRGPRVRKAVDRLRSKLRGALPRRRPSENLIIGSWNLGKGSPYKMTEESQIYLAEIARHFDVLLLRSRGRATNLLACSELLGEAWSGIGRDSTFKSDLDVDARWSREAMRPKTAPRMTNHGDASISPRLYLYAASLAARR